MIPMRGICFAILFIFSSTINSHEIKPAIVDLIIADGQAKTLRGLDGDDTYFISNLLPKNSTIEVIDTSGSNTIQIAANTKVNAMLPLKLALKGKKGIKPITLFIHMKKNNVSKNGMYF